MGQVEEGGDERVEEVSKECGAVEIGGVWDLCNFELQNRFAVLSNESGESEEGTEEKGGDFLKGGDFPEMTVTEENCMEETEAEDEESLIKGVD